MVNLMSPRERVLAALTHKRPDRIPKELTLCPALYEEFCRRTGCEDLDDYFGLEPRWVGITPSQHLGDFSKYLSDVPGIQREDEWGVGYMSAGFHHFERMVHPLRDARSPRDVAAYPWPDLLAPYRWKQLPAEIASWHVRGYPVCLEPPSCSSVFETCWYLRGQEQFLIDFYDNPDIAAALLDKVNSILMGCVERLADADLDIVMLGDDVGSQRSMIMSPETWRKWIKPRLAMTIAAGKRIKPDFLIHYHSDGLIGPIIPDLIEVGVDILNPVQPECMDPAELKRRYGDRLSFWGTIGTQSTMPFGTPDELRRVIKERIDTVGPEGLLLAPTHVLEPDVPWENVLAFVEAVEEYGRL